MKLKAAKMAMDVLYELAREAVEDEHFDCYDQWRTMYTKMDGVVAACVADNPIGSKVNGKAADYAWELRSRFLREVIERPI